MRTPPQSHNLDHIRTALLIETLVLCCVFVALWATKGFAGIFAGMYFDAANMHWINNDQYAYLAHALVNGSVTLDLPVAPELIALENPYDVEARMLIGADSDVQIFWDHAYFKGAYYSYFGVVPALLLFMPFELLSGTFLNTSVAVAILGTLATLAMGFLVWHIIRTYFQQTATVVSSSLALLVLFSGSNFVYLGSVPRFYSVPILASFIFTFLGIAFWLKAKELGAETAGAHHAGERAPSPAFLFLGSLCMALNLGCRPQFMLACLLAFPLFWDEIFVSRKLFSRSGLAATLAAVAPFVFVSLPLLAYNYVRFGSIFDFGSFYNLTGFDMTSYSQSPYLTLVLLFCYLFQPFFPSPNFPFFNAPHPDTMISAMSDPLVLVQLLPVAVLCIWLAVATVRASVRLLRTQRWLGILAISALVLLVAMLGYMAWQIMKASDLHEMLGFSASEPMFGGYFGLVPVALLVLFLPRAKEELVAKGLWPACVAMAIFAAIVLVVDTRIAGITQRYFGDFGWYIMVVACLVLLSLQAFWSEKNFRRLTIVVVVALAFSATIGGLTLLSPDRFDALYICNPELDAAINAVVGNAPR